MLRPIVYTLKTEEGFIGIWFKVLQDAKTFKDSVDMILTTFLSYEITQEPEWNSPRTEDTDIYGYNTNANHFGLPLPSPPDSLQCKANQAEVRETELLPKQTQDTSNKEPPSWLKVIQGRYGQMNPDLNSDLYQIELSSESDDEDNTTNYITKEDWSA